MLSISLLISCLLIISFSGCYSNSTVEPKPVEQDQVIEPELNKCINRGNTVGNIVNLGRVAKQGDWVYYIYQDELLSNNDNYGHIYRIRTDGSEREKINHDRSKFLNVLEDWIYYCNRDDGAAIYKVRTDGSERLKINNDASVYLNVFDDWIYYSNLDDDGAIYRIRTDGSDRLKLNDVRSLHLNVVNDYIYYLNLENQYIYKVSTDGSNLKRMNNERTMSMNVVDGWIYYVNRNDNHSIYKMSTDGNERKKLNDHRTDFINVSDGWIYYINRMDGKSIYKLSTDGQENERIVDDSAKETLYVIDDWIYYINLSEYRKYYRIRTDGSERESFGGYCGDDLKVFEPVTYVVNVEEGSSLFIRQNPGIKDKPGDDILDKMPKGSMLEVLNNHDNNVFVDGFTWWEVLDSQKGTTGWVAAEYLIKKTNDLEAKINITDGYNGIIMDKVIRGNTAGNIVNKGFAALKGEWIFFSYHDYTGRSDVGGIKKISIYGNGLTDVNQDFSGYINIIDDWIYYSNYDENRNIYRIKVDGSRREKLNDEQSTYLNTIGEWIYYLGDGQAICKIRTDGSEYVKLYDYHTYSYSVLGEWIYFVSNIENQAGIALYKMNLDGSGLEKLDHLSPYINYRSWIICSNGWYYYTEGSDRNRIYRVKLDGSKHERITRDSAGSINLDNGWIYYKNKAEGQALYRIRTDGSGRTNITDHYAGHTIDYGWFKVLGDWIIYYKQKDDKGFYMIRTDGSEWQQVVN